MRNRRGGATTSLVLAIAGLVGVGVAGGMALTGTTPCSILSACGVKPSNANVQTVAMTGAEGACPVTGKTEASQAAGASDCCSASTMQAAAPAVDVQVVTASLATETTKAEGELCEMAGSCSPANCTEGMMKACTESGKVCPQDKSATVRTAALGANAGEAHADCSNDPECAVDDGVACSSKGADCHKVQPATSAEAVEVNPAVLRSLRTLSFTAKGMPMLVPAALFTASGCEVKQGEGCGGCSSATTASLN
jgi:hypothetical protein